MHHKNFFPTERFLAGGGEMGALMRAKDWSKTSVGEVSSWPLSLRITLGIILNSKFPMFLFWGPDLVCFYNDAYRVSLGTDGKHPDILGQAGKVAWAEIWDSIGESIEQVSNGGEATWSEDHLVPIHRNGQLEDVYWTYCHSPVLNEYSETAGVLVTVTETTAEKLAKREHLRFKYMADNASDPFILMRKDATFAYLNQLALNRLGYTSEEAEHIRVPDIDLNYTEELFKGAILEAQNTVFQPFETLHKRKDGYTFSVEVNMSGFELEGEPYLFAVARDITYRKQAEQIIQNNEEKFRLLTQLMPQFIWTSDAAGNLNYFSQSVFDYSGLSQHEISNEGWLQIVHPDDRAENVRLWQHSIESGEIFAFEHRFCRHDGAYRWQLSRAVPQRDVEGRIVMWVGTSTDIHEHKSFAHELENKVRERTRELQQLNKELVSMNQELSSFAYVASHDLQEPLRKIQTFSSRITQKEFPNLSDNGKEYLQRMGDAAKRMQQLIEDLLTYSRTSTSEKTFVKMDLNLLWKEVVADFETVIREEKAAVETDTLPTLLIIPYQIRQLFTNLFANSLKFRKSGGTPVISLQSALVSGSQIEQADSTRTYHHLTFRDNGIGFEPVYNKRIFEVFQRLHGRSEYEGTGIGLAICKKIVENHHGFITATGFPNQGATFHLYFPVN